MEIEIRNHKTGASRYLPITKITPLTTGPLILGTKTTYNVNGDQCPFYEFFPVLQAAAIEIGTGFKENFIAYFFYNHEGDLKIYANADIDDGKEYIYDDYGCKLLNYDGYCKLCELTGENKLSLIDYFEQKDELVIPNTVVVYKNDNYSGDRMSKLFQDYPNQ